MSEPVDDPRSLAALRARYGARHRWWVLGTVMIGNMAALMAATTINVAVPAISQAFALGPQQAQWLATAFMGPMTLAMLATPWLLERFGYRATTYAMLALLGSTYLLPVFMVAALGLAPSTVGAVLMPAGLGFVTPALNFGALRAYHEVFAAMALITLAAAVAARRLRETASSG